MSVADRETVANFPVETVAQILDHLPMNLLIGMKNLVAVRDNWFDGYIRSLRQRISTYCLYSNDFFSLRVFRGVTTANEYGRSMISDGSDGNLSEEGGSV